MRALKRITGTGPVVTQSKQLATKEIAKQAAPTPVATVAPAAPQIKVTSVKVMTPEEIKAEVAKLLEQLAAETDGDAKKKIRRKLRLRGHYGGLGQRVSRKAVATAVPAAPVTTELAKKDVELAKK